MATKAFIVTPEQYLATQFEREPELVHGEIAERPWPNLIQAELNDAWRCIWTV